MVKEAQKQDRSWIVWMAIVVVAVVAAVGIAIWVQHEQIMKKVESSFAKTTDSDVAGHERFAEAYTKLTTDNVFVYRNSREARDILLEGSGIVFLCDPASAWCQDYALYLNEVAKNKEIKKVFYYNTPGGLKNSPDLYNEIAGIIHNNLQQEGKDRIDVPCTVFVSKGIIVAVDTETATESELDDVPEDYWTTERVEAFTQRIGGFIDLIDAE